MAIRRFIGFASSEYSNSANWEDGIVPGAGDVAFFTVLPPYPATFSAPADLGAMYFDIIRTFKDADGVPTAPIISGANAAIELYSSTLAETFIVQYGTITFTDAAQLTTNQGAVIGGTDPGLGVIDPGVNATPGLYAGSATPDAVYTGNTPDAGLRISAGAKFRADSLRVGVDGTKTNLGTGTVVVTGTGSVLQLGSNALFGNAAPVSGLLTLGESASGTLIVADGGVVTAKSIVLGSRVFGSPLIGSGGEYATTGSLSLTGLHSHVTVASLTIGNGGAGQVSIDDSGFLTVTGQAVVQSSFNPITFAADGQANLIIGAGGLFDAQGGLLVNAGTLSIAPGGVIAPADVITLINDGVLAVIPPSGGGAGQVVLQSRLVARASEPGDSLNAGTLTTAADVSLDLAGDGDRCGDLVGW